MATTGSKNNQENELTPISGPLIASPAGVYATSPRSGRTKFLVGTTVVGTTDPVEPPKKAESKKCSLV